MKLKIKNFQSFQDSEFELKDFTAIVGPSNRGKSAIVRALSTLLYNDWNASFLRFGEKNCEIELSLDKHIAGLKNIKVIKGQKNEYILDFEDGSTKTYAKVGKETPDELKNAGFDLIETERGDKYNLNFQRQLDPLFILSDSEVALTGFLNNLFNLGNFENALRKMQADLIQNGSEWKQLQDNIVSLEDQEKEVTQNISEIKERKEYLQKIITQLESLQSRLETINYAIEALQSLEELDTEIAYIKRNFLVINSIKAHIKVLHEKIESVFKAEKIINAIQEINESTTRLNNANKYIFHIKKFTDKNTSLISDILKSKEYFITYKDIIQKQVDISKASYGLTPVLKFTSKIIEHINTLSSISLGISFDKTYNTLSTQKKIIQNIFKVTKELHTPLKIDRAIASVGEIIKKEEFLNTSGIVEATNIFHKIKDDKIKQIGNCPLCGSNICKEH